MPFKILRVFCHKKTNGKMKLVTTFYCILVPHFEYLPTPVSPTTDQVNMGKMYEVDDYEEGEENFTI